jgi:emericellamide synthase (highly reducing iterative type I polyketide synthase)
LISGATEESCQTLARKLSSWVSEAAQTSDDGAFLERLAHTLMHRTLHKRRIAIIASSSKELASQLQDAGNKPVPASSLSTSHRLGFIFGGQGAQYFDMARGLSSTWPAFADSLKRAERQLMVLGADWNLTKELDRSSQESRVDQPAIGQAASTAVQLGLIDAFEALGIRPDMVAGHSSGEISAAYCAGLLSFEDAMTVAYHRGRLTSAMLSEAVSDRAPGAMLAVGASAAVVESHLSDPTLQAAGQLTIACYNSPASVTVSGDEAAIHCLAQRLEAASVFNRVLRTGGAAYHSHHMHAIKESYMAALQGLPWRGRESSSSSTIMISSVTGQILNLHEINGEYWARNLVAPVRFETCLRKMCDTNNDVSVIVELGPHATLEGPVKQTLQALNASARVHYVPTLRRKTDADGALLNAVAKLYCHNVKGVDLQRVNCGFHDDTPARLIDVPPYAFDHGQTFWHESRLSRAFRHPSFPPHELLGNLAVDNNEYEPHWRRFLGVNDVKWLQGHVIQGQVVFPAAAYLAVAAEALDRHRNRQVRSDGEAVRSGGFDFRNVSFGKALVLRDDLPLDHELCVSLRPEVRSSRQSSESWMDFRVYSVSLERGWAEHCRGSISRLSQSLASDETHEQSAVDHSAQTTYLRKVESSHFYKKCRDVGLEWATPFDNLTTLLLDDSTCDYTVATPNILSTADTNAERTTYCMHPALLDAALFHGMCALVFLNDARPSAMVPTFIQRLVIDDRARHYKSDLMCRAVRDNALTSEVTVTPMSSAGEAATPILRAYGVSLTKLPSDFAATDASHQICHVPRWFPYHSIATTADLQSLADSATSQLTTLPRSMLQQNITLNDQTRMYVRAALDKVSSECVVDDYRKLYLSWMTELVGGSEDNSSAESSEDGNKKEALGAVGQAIKAIGTNLPGILQGRVEPLAVLAADNVLSTIYSDERCQRCYAQIGAFCTSLAQRVPRLKMLEVGAGTGALSEPILQTLSRASDTAIGRYDFTDISAGFMDAARARLSEFADVVQYHVLDAERAPAAQGFEEGSYDVVFAANVVHATASIKQTLQNIHRLLKPDGVLILMELTRDEPFYNLIFGALPGWWAGAGEGRIRSPLLHGDKWRSELNGAGFDAPMVHLHDYEEAEGGTISVIISRATGPIASTMTDKEQVELAYCFSGDHQLLQLQKTLSSELPNFGCSTVDVYTDSQPHILVVPPSICENLLLGSMSPMAWSCFRKKVLSSRAVLLVTKGVYMEKANPFGAAMLGFANTIRREQPETRIITLDLSNAADSKGSAAAIAKVLQSPSFALQNDASAYENHYAELDGQLFVLRMMSEPKMDQHIRNATGTSEPTLGPFSETTRSLTAEIAIPGVLDSLRWVDDVHAQEPLHPDEIELDLRAASINFKDVLIAAGQLEGTTEMRNDCSGVVTRVGENMKHRYKLNDRVCCYYSRSYANKPRVHGDCAAVLPDDLDFDQAASLPIVWGTAYYALVTKAKLAKGETVLIHSAAGAVGQAAIAIAHYLGAEVFATVGSATKREFLTSRYGIKDDHIFSSRDTSFGQGIRQMTSKKGVNVVLNSLSGELFRESCTCLGYGGRFVEIGRKDYLEDMLIPSRFFLANITFAYVDLALMIEVERPVVRELLRSVVDLASSGAVALTSITKMPISEIVSAFRTIQAAKHMGKIILSVEPQQQVKVGRIKVRISAQLY